MEMAKYNEMIEKENEETDKENKQIDQENKLWDELIVIEKEASEKRIEVLKRMRDMHK